MHGGHLIIITEIYETNEPCLRLLGLAPPQLNNHSAELFIAFSFAKPSHWPGAVPSARHLVSNYLLTCNIVQLYCASHSSYTASCYNCCSFWHLFCENPISHISYPGTIINSYAIRVITNKEYLKQMTGYCFLISAALWIVGTQCIYLNDSAAWRLKMTGTNQQSVATKYHAVCRRISWSASCKANQLDEKPYKLLLLTLHISFWSSICEL